jgi:DNA-binding transcriptional MerR regulator
MEQSQGFERTREGSAPLKNISDMAREFKVSLRTLRFYEDRGLLHPLRNGLTRLYSERDRRHLELILKGRRLGFTLTEIGVLLSEADAGEADLHLAPDRIRAQISHLEHQRNNLDQAIAELRCVETELARTTNQDTAFGA